MFRVWGSSAMKKPTCFSMTSSSNNVRTFVLDDVMLRIFTASGFRLVSGSHIDNDEDISVSESGVGVQRANISTLQRFE